MCLSEQFVPEGIELIASPPNFAVYDIFTYSERIENCPDRSSLKRLILSQVLTSYGAYCMFYSHKDKTIFFRV